MLAPMRRGPYFIAEDQPAEDQQDERLHKGDGQRIGDGHDRYGGDKSVGRGDQERGAQDQQATGARADRPGQPHDQHHRQHQRALHHETRGGDLTHGNRGRRKL